MSSEECSVRRRDRGVWIGRHQIQAAFWIGRPLTRSRRPRFRKCCRAKPFSPCLHKINSEGNSGLAQSIPGGDLIVSLGGFTNGVGTSQENAGTLMHELGHTLGLRHGGADDTLYKPNYLSVMNYSFQLNGLTIAGVPGNSLFPLCCPRGRTKARRGGGSLQRPEPGTLWDPVHVLRQLRNSSE